MAALIEAEGLSKHFGKVRALDELDLSLPSGQVVAILGPNGSGKTTFIRTVATLLRPDAGTLRVAGLDVTRESMAIRRRIGLAGQSAAVEGMMTGRENLRMVARLYGQGKKTARSSTERILDLVGLDRGRRPPGPHLFGRHAAPTRPGRQPGGHAAPVAARRAHHRSRPGQSHRVVGCHPRPGQRRHRHSAHHPVPR